ncbi:MAG: PAS domain S-box protein [Candidatus Ozemobacteraceae bacterium]
MNDLITRLFEFTGDGVYQYDFDNGSILKANQGFCRLLDLDCSPEGVIGRPLRDLLIYTEQEGTIRHALEDKREIHNFTYHFKTLKGNDRWVLHDAFLTKNPETGQRIVETVVKDITERVLSQEALIRLQLIIDRSPVVAFQWQNIEGWPVIFVSENVRQFGYSSEDFYSRRVSWLDITHPDDVPRLVEELQENQKRHIDDFSRHYRVKNAKGEFRHVEDRITLVRNPDESMTQFQGIILDVSDRHAAQESLAAEKERLAVTLRSIGDGVIASDCEGKIILMNRVAETLTEWSQDEVMGKPLRVVFNIIDEFTRLPSENPVEKVLANGGIVGLESHTILISKTGNERAIAKSGSPIRDPQSRIIGVVLVFRDVTVERQHDIEMQRIEKLESLSLLAGGLAHDFNNILTGIIGSVGLIRIKTPGLSPDCESLLKEAENACGRAQGLTQQLLTFSKGGTPIKEMASLTELLRETTTFLLHGSRIICEFNVPEDLWNVQIDKNQISQVIQNLVINADQAMPGGGVLRITASNVRVPKGFPIPLLPGPFVKIDIADTGIGIPERLLSRIFDPYFSTKQKGSGLGLSTSYSIIRRHEGIIFVDSVLGKGSTFHLYLPAFPDFSATSRIVPETNNAPVFGRVLVMDDDLPILYLVKEALNAIGCQVVGVTDGQLALDSYSAAKKAGQPFDLVILDLTVPGGMGGVELMKKLQAHDPLVKAIVTSGYSTDPVISHFQDYGFAGYLCKPYRINELMMLIRSHLHP